MYRPSITTITSFAAVGLAAAALGACGKDDENGPGTKSAGKTTSGKSLIPPTVTGDKPKTTKTEPASTQPKTTATGCEVVSQPAPKTEAGRVKPSARLDRKRTFTAVMQTSCGRIDIRLDLADSPRTSASFASLARTGFYDTLTFHRVARPSGTAFVIQGGDPTGTGNGGPGYSVVEAPPSGQQYRRGVVAMAKTEIEAAGTSGSQFFIVTAPDAGLPPDYAVLGRVVRGLDVVDRIGEVPTDPTTEVPTEPVVIETVKIAEAKRK